MPEGKPKKSYQRYFETQDLMFPVRNTNDQFENKHKIIGIEIDGKFKEHALKKLKKNEPIRDTFNGADLIIFYDKNQIRLASKMRKERCFTD